MGLALAGVTEATQALSGTGFSREAFKALHRKIEGAHTGPFPAEAGPTGEIRSPCGLALAGVTEATQALGGTGFSREVFKRYTAR